MKISAENKQLEFQIFNEQIDLTKSRPLNPAYVRIAGNPDQFDREFLELKENGGDLIGLQENQARRGFKTAELVKTARGWSVYEMAISGAVEIYKPDISNVLFNLPEAIDTGKKWVSEDFDHREFIVRKNIIEGLV